MKDLVEIRRHPVDFPIAVDHNEVVLLLVVEVGRSDHHYELRLTIHVDVELYELPGCEQHSGLMNTIDLLLGVKRAGLPIYLVILNYTWVDSAEDIRHQMRDSRFLYNILPLVPKDSCELFVYIYDQGVRVIVALENACLLVENDLFRLHLDLLLIDLSRLDASYVLLCVVLLQFLRKDVVLIDLKSLEVV